ncbi:MAG TPA: hypothetical protein VF188_11310 [Longimicrobiales bacterium]
MSAPRVLIQPASTVTTAPATGSTEGAWGALGWFGALLALIGFGDIALTWYPVGLGAPEWEFATVSASLSGLPLPTMGLAMVLAAALAGGRRRVVLALVLALAALTMLVLGALGLFLTDVPIALRATTAAAARIGIEKVIIKTVMLGVGFSAAYVLGAATAIRYLQMVRGERNRA